MNTVLKCGLLFLSLGLAACATSPVVRPQAWSAPDVVVAPSSFTGVHGWQWMPKAGCWLAPCWAIAFGKSTVRLVRHIF